MRGDILARRAVTQLVVGPGAGSAADVVRHLTCVQSQEYAHATWSLGMRTETATLAGVQAEFDRGEFLRTHILRPTWHFVAAADLRWIQAVTAPRVQQLNAGISRREGLDQTALDRGTELIAEAVRGHHYRTRPELAALLAAAGLPSKGVGLAYIVMNAELEAVIASGPMRGAQHTYALLDERVPRSADATGGPGELLRRFLIGHGPAGLRDFARWSSLNLTQSAAALEEIRDGLEHTEVDGLSLWWHPSGPAPARTAEALLLPLYDELTLSFLKLGYPLAPEHPHPPDTDLFVGCIVLAEVNVGTWRRTISARKVTVELRLAPSVDAAGHAAAERAAARLADFLGVPLELLPG